MRQILKQSHEARKDEFRIIGKSEVACIVKGGIDRRCRAAEHRHQNQPRSRTRGNNTDADVETGDGAQSGYALNAVEA